MKTETRFTPGPWHHNGSGVWADAGVIVRSAAGYATLGDDLNLIVASPDMYTALQSAREYVGEALSLRRAMFADHEYVGGVSDIEACLTQIDAALAKAEGKA